jgi:hypothetical protein
MAEADAHDAADVRGVGVPGEVFRRSRQGQIKGNPRDRQV